MHEEVAAYSDLQRGRLDDDEMSSARICAQVQYLQDELHKTRELVALLKDALEPILMPDTTAKMAEVPGPPAKPASVLSGQIDEANGIVHSIQRRLTEIRERVQL